MSLCRWVPGFALLLALALPAGAAAPRAWTDQLIHKPDAWASQPGAVWIDPRGATLQIPPDRTHVIAGASGLLLPASAGRVRVSIENLSPGATWFVRLYGPLRLPDRRITISLVEQESLTGEQIIDFDPRLFTRRTAPAQLQLGINGRPGDHVTFTAVDFLPPAVRKNVQESPPQPGQIDLPAVQRMPDLPEPYRMLDWKQKALNYDRLAFDFNAKGDHLPLIWLDDSRVNVDFPTFGLPSYVGSPQQTPQRPGSQEGITCIGAVLGATLAGIDKSAPPHDFVRMCQAWFSSANGQDLVLNQIRGRSGGSFWYEIFPHIAFYALADRYLSHPRLRQIMRITADRWLQAVDALSGRDRLPDFDHVAFDFARMQARDNGKWKEPDAAAGVAYLHTLAWAQFHDAKYLDSADRCLRWLQQRRENPYYEVLLPWGVQAAARLNAEAGKAYDVQKMLNWCFGPSDCRGGWGVIVGRWNGYDCDGLVGSIDNRGGYAFTMNTFSQGAALVPVARYDARYARAIGKWMLNAANAARLFYPDGLPPGHQSTPGWTGDPANAIAYEGLRHHWQGISPMSTGDPVAMKWGPTTDLGLYGSAYVGFFGGIIRTTNVPGILQLNCLATDFFHAPAFPSFLYYNPWASEKKVQIDVGPGRHHLYDAASHRYLARDITALASFAIPADSAVLLVIVPAGLPETVTGAQRRVGGTVIDYRP